jgi:hypothetical protein
MSKHRRVRKSEPCPCGSGDKYRDCCHGKGFYWSVDEHDQFSKTIPMSMELREAIEQSLEEFRYIFDREPEGTDRIFPWSYIVSDEDTGDMIDALLTEVDIDPALRYATHKTGRIVTEANERFLTADEIQEWEEAFDEYYALQELDDEGDDTQIEAALEDLQVEFYRLPIIYGMFLQEAGSLRGLKTSSGFRRDSAFFYAAKSLKTVRAVSILVDSYFGEDSFALVRSMYENYLHIVFSVVEPERHDAWMRARLGLQAGTHTYGTNRAGKTDRRRIVETATGQEVEANITTYEMANLSPLEEDAELHSFLYSFLSEFTHPHLGRIVHYLSPQGFDVTKRNFAWDSYMLGQLVAFLNLDALLKLNGHPRRPRQDVERLLRRFSRKFEAYVQAADSIGQATDELHLLYRRAEYLARPW